MHNKPILYLIAAPIGNLRDISARALECLSSAPLIAAEDTRRARRLLAAFDIRGKEYISIREHNENRAAARLAEKIRVAGSAVYLSDAGTPAVSDPGARLVRMMREEDIAVVPIPGASALTALLSVAGLPAEPLHFFGFPPRSGALRQKFFASLPRFAGTVVLFEAPTRIVDTVAQLRAVFGDSTPAVSAREMTKQHEQIIALPLEKLELAFANGDIPARGEFALAIESPGLSPEQAAGEVLFDELVKELPPGRAAKIAARLGGGEADALYRRHISGNAPKPKTSR